MRPQSCDSDLNRVEKVRLLRDRIVLLGFVCTNAELLLPSGISARSYSTTVDEPGVPATSVRIDGDSLSQWSNVIAHVFHWQIAYLRHTVTILTHSEDHLGCAESFRLLDNLVNIRT